MAIKYWVNYLELALVPVKYGENGLRVSYKQPSRCVLQKAPLKNFAKFTRKHRARICFFLLLRESGTCVFLSTSRTFSEQLFNGLSLKQSSRQVSQNKCSAKFHIYIKKHLYGITFCTALNSTKPFKTTFYGYHRSSHVVVFRKKVALKIFAKFIGKGLCRSLQRDFNSVVFLWVSQKVLKKLFKDGLQISFLILSEF